MAGTAEALPLPSASADAAVVGEAFHWLAVEAAGTEIARLPDDDRRALLDAVRSIVAAEPRLALLYRTEVFTARRLDRPLSLG